MLDPLLRAGLPLERGEDWIETQPGFGRRPRTSGVTTQPYPGFPTDLEARWMTLMCFADGFSIVTERINPDRSMHMAERVRLGAHPATGFRGH